MVHFSGTLTEEQWNAALRLFRRPKTQKSSQFSILGLVILASVVGITLAFNSWIPLGAGIVILFGWQYWMRSPWRTRHLFERGLLGQSTAGNFDAHEIVIGTYRVAWSTVQNVQRDTELVTFEAIAAADASRPLLIILARAFFRSDDDWRDLLARLPVTPSVSQAPQRSRVASLLWTVALWIVIVVTVILIWSLTHTK